MASTVKEAVYLRKSVIWGHHVYRAVWSPVLGEVHCLALEEGNEHDHFTTCVKRDEMRIWDMFLESCPEEFGIL